MLGRYFNERGLFDDLDFAEMDGPLRNDDLFAAWLDLPESERNSMDAEFREIFGLSNEKGFRAIIDEAEWHLSDDHEARDELVAMLLGAIQPFRAGDGGRPGS